MTSNAAHARRVQLEDLADAVRDAIQGLPDHPWIPGAFIAPVIDALKKLDGENP